MAAEPFIEEVLQHTAPDLRLVPDWAPQPGPEEIAPGFGIHAQWGDVWNWVKDSTRHLLPAGRPVLDDSLLQANQYTDTVAGQTMKALSGYLDQNAAMTVQAAELLESAIDTAYANQIHDYQDLSTRIDALQQGQDFIAAVVVPTIRGEIAQAEARAYGYALAAQANAEDWGLHKIFAPLYEELLKVQPAIDAGVDRAEHTAHVDAAAQVGVLGAAVGTLVTPIRTAVQALTQESEDCVQPMCETMGPKTDLGKLLKGLANAAEIAAIAELVNLKESDLTSLLQTVGSKAASYISFFEDHFVEGGETIGGTITRAVGSAF